MLGTRDDFGLLPYRLPTTFPLENLGAVARQYVTTSIAPRLELRVARIFNCQLVIGLDRKLQGHGRITRAGVPFGNWGVAAPDPQLGIWSSPSTYAVVMSHRLAFLLGVPDLSAGSFIP